MDQNVARCLLHLLRLGMMGDWMVMTLKKYFGVVNSTG